MAKATTTEEKVQIPGLPAKTLMNVHLPEAENYGRMIQTAEMPGDRKFMVRPCFLMTKDIFYLPGRRENIDKAINRMNRW